MKPRNRRRTAFWGGSVASWLPLSAQAHTEDMASGFVAGFTHPIFGTDHLLAMMAVGVVSALLGGAHIWRVPVAFVLSMVVGGVLGVLGWAVPHGEVGIAVSIVLLGAAIVLAPDMTPPAVVTGFAMLFGIFHGHAHGLEMPHAAEPAFYTLGFVLSTAALHLAGVAIGELGRRHRRPPILLKSLGSAVAVCGVYFLMA